MRSRPPTLRDSRKYTSSLGSGDGDSHLNSLDSQKTFRSGLPPSHASPTQSLVGTVLSQTLDPHAPERFWHSLLGAKFRSSLASKLQARMALTGTPEYRLSWSGLDTQPDRPCCVQRALPHPTSGPASTGALSGWGTPCSTDWKGSSSPGQRRGQVTDHALRAALGSTPKSLTATEAGLGVFNPDLSRWLMGYPTEWTSALAMGTQWFPKSRPPLSNPSATLT
jgi:hypothetical protein